MGPINSVRISTVAALMLIVVSLFPASANAGGREPNAAGFWNAPAINWLDVPAGIRASSKTGRPAIMLFHASWCTSCRRYRNVWQDPGVVEASKNFVMILVDVDQRPDINGAFSPDGTYVPRTIFISPNGDVLSQYHGKDPEYPHTIDIDNPTELRSLMQRATRELGLKPMPERDRRAFNHDAPRTERRASR